LTQWFLPWAARNQRAWRGSTTVAASAAAAGRASTGRTDHIKFALFLFSGHSHDDHSSRILLQRQQHHTTGWIGHDQLRLHSSLSSSTNENDSFYGLPVGVVDLPRQHIHPFLSLLQETLDGPPYFRGTQVMDDNDKQDRKRIHLAVPVADALLHAEHEHHQQLWQFLNTMGGTFTPGVRMTSSGIKTKVGKKKYLIQREQPKNVTTKPKFTFVELFAGIGGFRLGLEALGGRCTLACESNDQATRIYQRHFLNNNNHNNNHNNATLVSTNNTENEEDHDEVFIQGDVLDLVRSDFPNHGTFDLLTAGFPCQPFSVRGEQKGLHDKNATKRQQPFRGQVYQEIIRVLRELQPPYLLLENVVGLVRMEGGWAAYRDDDGRPGYFYRAGNVMQQIVADLAACGYRVEWRVIHSHHFVPQYRDRVYIVGTRLDLNYPGMNWENVIPSERGPLPPLRHLLQTDYASCPNVAESTLLPSQWEKTQQTYKGHAMTEAQLRLDNYAPTVISNYRVPSSNTTKLVMEEFDGTPRRGEKGLLPRFLTPREIARIMGFPEDYDLSATGDKPRDIQLGHLYKCLGNAVVPPVIEAIARELLQLKPNDDGTA